MGSVDKSIEAWVVMLNSTWNEAVYESFRAGENRADEKFHV